jgi:protein-S-isoprenylcysteine O-methyltransferase Ste14
MSIFAVPSLGIFNLWIMPVLYSLPILFTITFRKRIFEPTSSNFNSSSNSFEKNLFIISKFLMLGYFLYSIVVPIHLGTVFGMIGLTLYIIGYVIYTTAWITIANSEKGKIYSNGPFRYSRHPIYFSSAIQFVGAGFISQSWLYLGFSIIVGISHMRNAFVEEQICSDVFGDEYKQYMDCTPRWFGWRFKKLDK